MVPDPHLLSVLLTAALFGGATGLLADNVHLRSSIERDNESVQGLLHLLDLLFGICLALQPLNGADLVALGAATLENALRAVSEPIVAQ